MKLIPSLSLQEDFAKVTDKKNNYVFLIHFESTLKVAPSSELKSFSMIYFEWK